MYIDLCMKLAILADIHANLPALEAVLADVQQYGVDGIIVAGDLIGGGPQPVQGKVNCQSLTTTSPS